MYKRRLNCFIKVYDTKLLQSSELERDALDIIYNFAELPAWV